MANISSSDVPPPEFGSKGRALPSDFSELPEFIAAKAPLKITTFDFLTMIN